MTDHKLAAFNPRFLCFLSLCYSMVIVFANWFDPRLVDVFGLISDAGTLIFPLSFLLSAVITEVYGYRHARRAIWAGFFFNALFILYGQLIIHLPSPSIEHHNDLFAILIGLDNRIIFASAISYLCAEPLNSLLMAKLKIRLDGRYLSVRFIIVCILAALLDSFIFGFLAFFHVINFNSLINLIFTMCLLKIAIELLGLPASILLINKLKRLEQLDIYDTETNFNLFSLKANYTVADNKLSTP